MRRFGRVAVVVVLSVRMLWVLAEVVGCVGVVVVLCRVHLGWE